MYASMKPFTFNHSFSTHTVWQVHWHPSPPLKNMSAWHQNSSSFTLFKSKLDGTFSLKDKLSFDLPVTPADFRLTRVTAGALVYTTFVNCYWSESEQMFFQDRATRSRDGVAEEGDGASPLREQTASSRGDGANDGPRTNNNSVGIMADHSS